MLSLEWGWALLLLPLPLLARRLLPAMERNRQALTVPLLNRPDFIGPPEVSAARGLAKFCLWSLWICLLLAASRPYWLGEPITRHVSGRDLMLAIDISGSMSEADMTINSRNASRLEVLQVVATRFIERREGDRLGLILFGTNAYSFVPMTFDLDTLKQLLGDVSTGLAGRHTAIGDAIGLAVKIMREQEAEHKVLILATDGSNTSGFEDPVRAAVAARQQGMTIYTIGVGSDAEALGRTYGSQGIPPGTAMNETVLKRIAAVTGGDFFRATDTASLERIYAVLDELEPIEYEYQTHRPRSEVFYLPLAAGMLLLLVTLAWSMREAGGEDR